MLDDMAHALDSFDYGTPCGFANLTMIPLLGRELREPGYVTLDEALTTGRFRVTEVSEGGRVPELRVHNDLDTPVLLVDGEELVGAKQNRVLNLTVLVPARAEQAIPVSCVEAHRWRATSDAFQASRQTQFREGRAHKMAQVSRSLAIGLQPASDQADVWARIEHRAASLGAESKTGAMHDIYEQQRHGVDEFVAVLGPADRQIGVAMAIGGRLAGVELFDATRTLQSLLPKIVASYALDAIVAPDDPASPACDEAAVSAWLTRFTAASPRVHPSVGLGDALRWEAPDATAAALRVDEHLVHFAAFPLDSRPGGGRSTRLRAASERREHLR